MISIREALQILQENLPEGRVETVDLSRHTGDTWLNHDSS